MILLDTNVVSELMKGQPDPPVRDWLDRRTGDGLFVSAITQAEIGLGIALLPDGSAKKH
ncbi:MAG: PIN domain-containing protein [Gammaproteobacteria bacterium]